MARADYEEGRAPMPDGTWAQRRDASDGVKRRLRDGAALRAAREAHPELSQRKLAAELGCGDRILGHLETGTRAVVYASLADAIEDALHVPRGSLFVNVEE